MATVEDIAGQALTGLPDNLKAALKRLNGQQLHELRVWLDDERRVASDKEWKVQRPRGELGEKAVAVLERLSPLLRQTSIVVGELLAEAKKT